MATTMLGAIIETFDGSPAASYVSVSGGLWVGEIPEDRAAQSGLPWVAVLHMGEVPDYTTESGYSEVGSWRFEVYHDNLETAETIAQKIKDTFDCKRCLNVTSANNVEPAERLNYSVNLTPYRTPADKPVYLVSMPYQVLMGRTLA